MDQSILDVSASPVFSLGDMAIRRSQEIPEDFLKSLREERAASSAPAGEFHRVCSVPVAVHETWLRHGFDMTKASAKEILARLRSHGLDAFITSNKL